MVAGALALVLVLSSLGGRTGQAPRADCSEWHECRDLALAAADRGDYERFHDLAWRAVQTGPPREPALMYLLARAQALSGRPHDALVMIDRLAGMGIATDAATDDAFIRTRQLVGWPDVAVRIERLRHPGSAPPPALSTGSPSARAGAAPSVMPATASPRSSELMPVPVVEAVRFSAPRFSAGGLAYDAVSRRFLFADRRGRRLIVVGDGADHGDDLVRSDSAGFQEISAMEVDARRGDVWVASTAADGAATLHKLQLVSGRPLKIFQIAANLDPVKVVDIAVTTAGTVLALDAAGNRVLVLRPGDTTVKSFVPIHAEDVSSLTASGDEIAYVAHGAHISRVDVRARTASLVAMPKQSALARLERIRWHRSGLIAVDVDGEGARRIVRLDLNSGGRAITRATTLEALAPQAAETFVTIAGDDLLYLTTGSSSAEVVAYRAHLPRP